MQSSNGDATTKEFERIGPTASIGQICVMPANTHEQIEELFIDRKIKGDIKCVKCQWTRYDILRVDVISVFPSSCGTSDGNEGGYAKITTVEKEFTGDPR